jgi:putative nucleotidyltransferase with HDIG domain
MVESDLLTQFKDATLIMLEQLGFTSDELDGTDISDKITQCDSGVSFLTTVTGDMEGEIILTIGKEVASKLTERLIGGLIAISSQIYQSSLEEFCNILISQVCKQLNRGGVKLRHTPPRLTRNVDLITEPLITMNFKCGLVSLSFNVSSKEEEEQLSLLINKIRNYDLATWEHSSTVALLSHRIGSEMGLTGWKLDELFNGAILHDIGKCKISEDIILAPRLLTDEEWTLMREHVTYGTEIMKDYKNLIWLVPYIRYHHEHWDGNGYLKLKGESIHAGARIVALADAIDAMIGPRLYRDSLSPKECIEEIKKHAGTQFYPTVVQNFLNLVSKQGKDLWDELKSIHIWHY